MADQEQVAIVDENDQILGYKFRRDLLTSDRIRISSIWIENDNGEVLIAKRVDTKLIDPGCWGPAASGTVQKDTSYDETAYQELSEEIGITAVTLTKRSKEIYTNFRGHARVCQWYSLVWDGKISDLTLQKDEVAAAKWIPKHNLLKDIKTQPDHYVASAQMWPRLFNF